MDNTALFTDGLRIISANPGGIVATLVFWSALNIVEYAVLCYTEKNSRKGAWCMKLDGRTFDPAAFVAAHPGQYVIFVSGGWNFSDRTAYYDCLLCFDGHRKRIHKVLKEQSSPNAAMLIGAMHACSLLKKESTMLYLIAPTALGFKKGLKGKGPNADLVNGVLGLCAEKKIEVVDMDLFAGGDLIRNVIEGKVRV